MSGRTRYISTDYLCVQTSGNHKKKETAHLDTCEAYVCQNEPVSLKLAQVSNPPTDIIQPRPAGIVMAIVLSACKYLRSPIYVVLPRSAIGYGSILNHHAQC